MISPPLPLCTNLDDSKAPSSSPVVGAAGGAFSMQATRTDSDWAHNPALPGSTPGPATPTSVAPTSNGGIGQSGSEPGTTTDTYNRDRRSLAGLRPMWIEPAINLRAVWRRP